MNLLIIQLVGCITNSASIWCRACMCMGNLNTYLAWTMTCNELTDRKDTDSVLFFQVRSGTNSPTSKRRKAWLAWERNLTKNLDSTCKDCRSLLQLRYLAPYWLTAIHWSSMILALRCATTGNGKSRTCSPTVRYHCPEGNACSNSIAYYSIYLILDVMSHSSKPRQPRLEWLL